MINYHRAMEADIPYLIKSFIDFSIELGADLDNEKETAFGENLRSYFRKALPNESYINWIAMSENKFAGSGGLVVVEQPGNWRNISGKWGYIKGMYTVPEFRKKGICGNILNRLIASARDLGITGFELHATKAGQPVYEKNGFIEFKEPTFRKYYL